jgi:hypothetical protein
MVGMKDAGDGRTGTVKKLVFRRGFMMMMMMMMVVVLM